MLKKSIGALLISTALFSCQPNSKEVVVKEPNGWEIMDTPVKSSLRGLSVVTEDIIWASGSGGVWLKSLDGGQTWTHGIIGSLDSVDFRSIYAFNAEKAIAVAAGQPAVIYKTEDGGETWSKKHQEPEDAFLDGVSFADFNRGYVFGDPVEGRWTILETKDQGESWNLIDSLPLAESGEAGFAASASSLLARGDELWLGSGGTVSNLYYSPNRGGTWEKYKSNLSQGNASQGIFSLTQAGNGEIIAVGGDYSQEDEIKGNAGLFLIPDQKWIQPSTPPAGYRSGIAYFPHFHWVIATGPSGSDFSSDGGKNWTSFSSEGFHAVSRAHAGGAIWASGAGGKIGRLTY
ncbi:YCF48-related protein [Algoriphagus sp.]|uniref:WD40/YVTN/BNR-like repeat-containing protein n=1 Tax=Algoriphagus sp. TaxID=1872435 RepID=UPI0026181A09|nr:YCF48-related protein [Algoriphagus sp.]